MPIMDGIEASRQIRGFEQKLGFKRPVKIIALTGVAHNDLQRDSIGAGIDSFMTKPARMASLVPLLEESGVLSRDPV